MVTMNDMVNGKRFQKPELDPWDCIGPVELVIQPDSVQLFSVVQQTYGLKADTIEEMLDFLNEVDAYVVSEDTNAH